MTAGQKILACAGMPLLKSSIISAIILAPALIAAIYLVENQGPIHAPYLVACVILLLAALDFALVIIIEPYRSKFSKLTLPAFIGAMAIVLLFVIMEAANRFFENLGYSVLTPVVAAGVVLLYATVFTEKNIVLKCYLSINSVALMFLWAMGAIDKITLPF